MAQRPPKRYDPGELDRVRGRLGDISQDEAKRMAKLLGGEVGVERNDAALDERYRKLAELNRRRSDRFVPPPVQPPPDRVEAGRPPTRTRSTPRRAPSRTAPSRPGFFARLRMDFLASRPEHQIKSRWNAFAALFSFLMEVDDFVSPRFVKEADAFFFTTIENLVIAVRKLMARYEKATVLAPRIHYFNEILSVVKDWDIEGMAAEIARLQANPRRLRVEECTELCRMIFTPIVRLCDLDPNYHIGQALKHFHDVDMLSLPKDSPDTSTVKLQYSMARDMQLRVFVDLKHRLYPLLLKLAVTRFCSLNELFSAERDSLLRFLQLSPEKVIAVKELRNLTAPEAAPGGTASGDGQAAGSEAAAEEEEGADETEKERPPAPVQSEEVETGLALLDELFPQAGWLRIIELPDMFPYFHPIFDFPRGAELIPAEDPLQQIVVLVALLQELFYGFRAIRFGTLLDEHGNSYRFGDTIEGLTENWHLFLDELLGKNYLSLLNDYAHHEEHAGANRLQSEYSEKLELDLLWTKRRYVLPKLRIKIRKGLRPNVSPQVPKLWETVRDVREALEKVDADFAGGRAQAIENSEEEFSFAVESFISKRLRLVLARRRPATSYLSRRTSNASLVHHTLSILRLLDRLLNDEQSFYYECYNEVNHPLYRRDPSRSDAPLYTVPLEDPFKLIDNAEAEARARDEKRLAEEGEIDPATGMGTGRLLTRKLTELAHTHNAGGPPFVMLPLSLRRYGEIQKQSGKEAAESLLVRAAEIILSEIRDFADLPYRAGAGAFVLLLPETTGPEALHLVERLSARLTSEEAAGITVSMGIIEHQPGWTIERLVKAAQEAIREAARYSPPAAVIFSESESAFLPVGSRQSSSPPTENP